MVGQTGQIVPTSLYQPIDPSETRILELLPASKYDADIICNLTVVGVQSWLQTQFEALSYTWGDPTSTCCAEINGFKVPIRVNLEHFLRQRRQHEEPVLLWVDAVCINQEDLDEKNNQIPIMNLIYTVSKMVTVWLGPASEDSSLAMQSLEKIGSELPFAKMPILNSKVIQALQNFLNRPYWFRAWIVQEIVLGSSGIKLDRTSVMCGPDKLRWTTLVIAAVRMKAYQEDLRQYFPSIEVILQFDELRDQVYELVYIANRKQFPLELVSRYRHFQATDPRDKIYAFVNIFTRGQTDRLKPRYEVPVAEVFVETAEHLLFNGFGPEMLRQCGHRSIDLPSWAPDWSTSLKASPLPSKLTNEYSDVPWWSETLETTRTLRDGTQITEHGFRMRSYPRDPLEAKQQKQTRFKRLEVAAETTSIVTSFDEIPPGFGIHMAPGSIKNKLSELLKTNQLVLAVSENDFSLPSSGDRDGVHGTTKNAVEEGERLTEVRFKKQLLRKLRATDSPYHASQTTSFGFQLLKTDKAVQLTGVIFDTVDTIHDAFIDDVDSNWGNATHFMVDVGKCKALATSHIDAIAHHHNKDKLLEAFWLTLFAGQYMSDGQFVPTERSNSQTTYSDWLPEIPNNWAPSAPPLTATTSGRAKVAETAKALDGFFSKIGRQTDDGGSWEYKVVTGEWSVDGPDAKEEQFRALGLLWNEQPYDLYHRPFDLLNVVPDPYWHIRKTDDVVAKERTRDNISMPLVSHGSEQPTLGKSRNPTTSEETVRWAAEVHESLKQEPSMIPQGGLGYQIEKYALGRRFFISKQGYFGLAPKQAKPGDALAIIFGVDVPFVLRQSCSSAGSAGWELLGEAYVHGVMNGEIIDAWKAGQFEPQNLTIV